MQKNDKKYKYVLVNGFGWSGSSAVVDLFREFNQVYVPNREFRIIKDPFGIIDLDRAINNPIDPLNEDVAIKSFLWMMKKYIRKGGMLSKFGLDYGNSFGHNIEALTKEYINELTDYKYNSYWWFLEMPYSYLKLLMTRMLRLFKIYDSRKKIQLHLTTKSEEEFVNITKKYINSIFEKLLENEDYNIIVLDQAIPANSAFLASRYFEDYKVIVVDRDPRDVYIDLIKEKSLVGYDVAMHHNVNLFIDFYKKVRRTIDDFDKNVIKLRFEDVVLNYNSTLSKIIDFIGLDKDSHIRKCKFLNPDISSKNVGIWKNYEFQSEIEAIKHNLKEYCIEI